MADDLSCGLRGDGSPLCWGSARYGRHALVFDEKFRQLAVGPKYVCGLGADGMISCRGSLARYSHTGDLDTKPDGSALSGFRFSAIFAGQWGRVCGISEPGGDLVCWRDVRGFEGASAGVFVYEGDYAGASVGQSHICGLGRDGRVECVLPMSVACGFYNVCEVPPPRVKMTWIVSGRAHACGLRSDGRAVCWTGVHENAGRDVILAVP